jgi:hypothetical protein
MSYWLIVAELGVATAYKVTVYEEIEAVRDDRGYVLPHGARFFGSL